MQRFFYAVILLCLYSKQHMVHATTKSGVEAKEAGPGMKKPHDDQEYRIAVGEKYISGMDSNDRSSWIDPYNMFNYDTPSVNEVKPSSDSESIKNLKSGLSESIEGKHTVESDKHHQELSAIGSKKCAAVGERELRASKCGQNEYVYVTRWLKKFLRKMNYSPDMDLNEIQLVQFSVVNRELHEVLKLLDSKNPKDVQDIEDIFDRIAGQMYVLHPESRSFVDVFHFIKDNSVIIFTLLVSLLSLWYLRVLYYNGISFKLITILVCLASIVWTWVHMYQKEIAKKQATLHSLGYPQECEQQSLDYLSLFSLYLRKTFLEMEDNCAKYYEAQIVDPFWKISPLVVVSETASNFILQPLGSVASHCNLFIKNMFSGMPLIMVIPTAFFAFFLMLMLCKYKLRLPFFFATLEPSLPASHSDKIEFLPFPNEDKHAITCDASGVASQPCASRSPQRALRGSSVSDFSGSGDRMQEISSGTLQQDQTRVQTSEEFKLSTEVGLNDNFIDVGSRFHGFGNVMSDTFISLKETACSPIKVALKDKSCQTDQI